jgi:hypothetical protein
VFITFDSTTSMLLQRGERDCFRAALLLRVFHAVLATLGLDVPFKTFLSSVDWETFTCPERYLSDIARALDVNTLAIAVDDFATGVMTHMRCGAEGEHAQIVAELANIFVNWGELQKRDTDLPPVVVVPIISCCFPRYVRAAEEESRHIARRLWVDLAPCVDDMINQAEPSRRPHLAKCFRDLYCRQQYAACGGHFQLCATAYAAIDRQASRAEMREVLQCTARPRFHWIRFSRTIAPRRICRLPSRCHPMCAITAASAWHRP